MITHSSAQIRTFLANWHLPLFMTREYKYPIGAAMYLFGILMYLASNWIHIFPLQMLPMSWFDVMVPFLPYTVWIYISEYVFFAVVYVTCKDMVNLNKYCYSFLFLQSVSVLIFWLWPTTYPRELFPLPDDLEKITHFAFSRLRETDTPANCCPSLHVSSVYLSTFIFLDDQKKKFPFFFIWGTAIALSTLTTKQHYLIDVVTGFMMAISTYWIFHKYVSYKPLAPRKRKSPPLKK